MKNIGLILEYEDVLLGKKANVSSTYINKDNPEPDVIAVLKYVFEDILGWDPETVRKFTTKELLKQLNLTRLTNKIEFPPELDREKDMFYIAWILYPQTIHHTKRELVLQVYQQVLDGYLVKFPKNFFLTASGEINACICLQYAINQYLKITSIQELYEMFSDINKARDFLREVKLWVPCQDIYDHPIDMLHDCLGTQRNDLYYMYGRFKAKSHEAREELKCESE